MQKSRLENFDERVRDLIAQKFSLVEIATLCGGDEFVKTDIVHERPILRFDIVAYRNHIQENDATGMSSLYESALRHESMENGAVLQEAVRSIACIPVRGNAGKKVMKEKPSVKVATPTVPKKKPKPRISFGPRSPRRAKAKEELIVVVEPDVQWKIVKKEPSFKHKRLPILEYRKCPICDYSQPVTKKTLPDFCAGCNNRAVTPLNNLALYTDLMKDYDPDNEQPADQIIASTHTRIKWICHVCSHKWSAPAKRRIAGSQCPGCAHRTVTPYNNMQVTHPHLAREFDEKKNGKLATEILAGTACKYWWICPQCDYSYKATGSNRFVGKGCPQCGKIKQRRGKQVVV